jgi:hypothetical protein
LFVATVVAIAVAASIRDHGIKSLADAIAGGSNGHHLVTILVVEEFAGFVGFIVEGNDISANERKRKERKS